MRPRASAWRTWRRPARAICWSFRRSATSRGRAAGSVRSIARCIRRSRRAGPPTRGPKCPAFKSKDIGAAAAERRNRPSPTTVCPGLHTFAGRLLGRLVGSGPGGGLKLGEKPPFGVRREDLIVKDVPAARDRRRPHALRPLASGARRTRATAGSVPSLSLATVREWTADPRAPDPCRRRSGSRCRSSICPQAAGGERSAPAGPHSACSCTPCSRRRRSTRRAHDPRRASPRREARAARARPTQTRRRGGRCRRARASRTRSCGRARAAADARRLPPRNAGHLHARRRHVDRRRRRSGVRGSGRWHVVDFKTDRELGADGEERYRRQVALYAAAIAAGDQARPADAMLIRIVTAAATPRVSPRARHRRSQGRARRRRSHRRVDVSVPDRTGGQNQSDRARRGDARTTPPVGAAAQRSRI